MLKNERQYRIAKADAERITRALAEVGRRRRAARDSGDHERERTYRAQETELRAQLTRLRTGVEEYEGLRSGKRKGALLRLPFVEQLPRRLIEARIAAGLTQKDLATKLGLKAQQIQHYEATDYASASLSRVLEVARALGAKG